jgi:glycosyltransferase involved in cell wall biosynthesis
MAKGLASLVRIAIVSPNPSLNAGGVERFCHLLRRGLAGEGATAEVIGLADVRRFVPDLTITNGMAGMAGVGPRVHVYHGCWVEHVRNSHREGSRQWRARLLARGVFREMRGGFRAYRVAVSETAADEVSRWYGNRVHRVVPNGVDIDLCRPGNRDEERRRRGVRTCDRVALFVGRSESRKRPDIASHAARIHGYQLHVAGPRSWEGTVDLGTLTLGNLVGWMRAADCVLAPSQYEACSFAVLEALATGTPVVASEVGWIRTLLQHVPDYRMIVAPPGDANAFADALGRLPGATSATGQASRFVRENNNLTRFTTDWVGVVDEVMTQWKTR